MSTIQMTAEHRKYAAIETTISTVINTLIGGLFAWLAFPRDPGQDVITLWGHAGFPTGMAFDLLPTCFMITLVTTLFVTIFTRKRLRAEHVAKPDWNRSQHKLLGLLPHNVVLRAIVLGIIALIAFVPLTLLIMLALGVTEMAFTPFLIFKLFYGALVAFVMTRVIVISALGDRLD